MMINPLAASIENFAARMLKTTDAGLDETWAWQSYASEGVRFAFFRTYEELRDLAARLVQRRCADGQPPTEAQHLLAQYHAAYRDLQASLLGLSPAQMQTAPAENIWPLRKVLAHILQADIGFYVVITFALEGIRAHSQHSGRTGVGYTPTELTDSAWDRIAGLDDEDVKALLDGPPQPIIAQQAANHDRVLEDFASISTAELEMPSRYWEGEPYTLRFRLHRFDSHMRQHTIQIDKTRAALGLLPTESQRLLRLIYAALAEVEGALIGYEQVDSSSAASHELTETARTIDARLAELTA